MIKHWRVTNADTHRGYHIKHQYGVDVEVIAAMYIEQGGMCAICSAELPDPSKSQAAEKKRAHIDHCHTSGHVRGILCYGCNSGIGSLKDDPRLLDAAAAYLRRSV